MAAEREAADDAVAVASTEESVATAAWTTAEAAAQARDMNADATQALDTAVGADARAAAVALAARRVNSF